MGQITSEQKEIIDQFSCERLTSKPENRDLISSFSSKKGELLVNCLQENGWKEDSNSHIAFYLIKSLEGIPVLFFSLKCGSLFARIDEEAARSDLDRTKQALAALKNSGSSDESEEARNPLLGGKTIELDEQKAEAIEFLKRRSFNIQQYLSSLLSDKEREWNPQNIQVLATYPGIELVHFCSCDSIKDEWNKLNIIHPFGEVMFWRFIAPLVYETQERVGCQYLFCLPQTLRMMGRL